VIPLGRGGHAQPGPAFVSREVVGHPWGGTSAELDLITNPDDISRLVVFDTWTANCDRHPPDTTTRKPNRDNVMLQQNPTCPEKLMLIAMDHTHCFTCGHDLTARNLTPIDRIKDSRVYGLFPEFQDRLQRAAIARTVSRLNELNRNDVSSVVNSIPPEWEVDPQAREALGAFILRRARYVAEHVMTELEPHLPLRQGMFDLEGTP